MLVALFTPKVRGIFFSTSPPLIGMVASIAHMIRRYPIAYWAMDLNPDQLITLGKISPKSFAARFLESMNRLILRNSSVIVALDRFMAQRLATRGHLENKMMVMPPWPHEEVLESLPHSQNPFRAKHQLQDKFVIMYSGNHSPSNPLTTLLDAAVRLKDEPNLVFAFIGGGIGKREVEQYIADHRLTNVISLPYQPLAELRYSLSAADVHVVSLGSEMVGIIHPCKIYGAMAVARPVLYFGPEPSHITDLINQHHFGLRVAHGDVEGAVTAITRLRNMSVEERAQMGQIAQRVLAENLSQEALTARFCDAVERTLMNSSPTTATSP
jgi:colanic acid biosynthesis glycosyl transferase WcaI